MTKIALTGNIASGKSVVQKILENKGFKVLDTDEVSHELLNVENSQLFEAFKNFDVFENGEFSRYKVGQLIFSNQEARILLNSIMHPQIKEKINEFFEKNKSENIVFVGIPLLFEANMQDLFDKKVLIYTDDEIRLKRLLQRNNYTIEHAKNRINSQMSQDKKVGMCDFIINNNGTIEMLQNAVEDFLKQV
jgi:dephospho-CoA kinase